MSIPECYDCLLVNGSERYPKSDDTVLYPGKGQIYPVAEFTVFCVLPALLSVFGFVLVTPVEAELCPVLLLAF